MKWELSGYKTDLISDCKRFRIREQTNGSYSLQPNEREVALRFYKLPFVFFDTLKWNFDLEYLKKMAETI